MPFEEMRDISLLRVTPEGGKGALGRGGFQSSAGSGHRAGEI